MKAIVYHKYGSPDVLELREIDKPVPKADEVLIKICASSINSADHRSMRADPFFFRFMGQGVLRPKRNILGIDMAGVVESVGENVTLFAPGDEVYGDVYASGTGAYTEYVCLPESATIVKKPVNMTFEKAAAVPVAGLTALQALRDRGQLKTGGQVLVNGASGGVGTFSVIIAKALGAEVTGVCSTRNSDLVRSIGADYVIDYQKQDVKQTDTRFDNIIDIAANLMPKDYRRLLKPGGVGILVGYSSLPNMVRVMTGGKRAAKRGITFGALGMAQASKEDLDMLREMMENGQITPAIDKVYPLEDTAEAMRYFEEQHARAKVVIRVC